MPPNNRALYKSAAGYAAMMQHYDEQLARLNDAVPVETCYLPTSFGETHVVTAGPEDAPPLVLLHGTNINAMMWLDVIPTLAKHYHIYAPDSIGMAGKSAPTRLPFKGDGYGHWLREVYDALGLPQARTVGISGGGWLALKLAAVAPERIERAVLMSSAGFIPGRFKVGTLLPMLFAMVRPSERNVRRGLQAWGVPSQPPTADEVAIFTMIVRHYRSQLAQGPVGDEQISRLTAPTLLLMGEHEFLFRPIERVFERARRLLPNLQAEVVPGAGHEMRVDGSDYVEERVLRFLQG